MHPQAREWVERFATSEPVAVLDIGGRDINGTVRALFPNATKYVSVDLYPGPAVDVVADIVDWVAPDTFDVVVCCEVLEHAADWHGIIKAAYQRLTPGGTFIMTCAGPGRPPHSAIDGEWRLHPGEHYGNVSRGELEQALKATGWASYEIDCTGEDTRCVAVR